MNRTIRKTVISRTIVVLSLALLVGIVGSAEAGPTFSFSQGDLAATATFSASGDTLTVVLTNTATADVTNPATALSGVFFDINGYVGKLTPVSAMLNDLSGVLFKELTYQPLTGYNNYAFGPGDIGSEVGYNIGASALGNVGDHVIGHVGMDGAIGNPDRFDMIDAHNLQGPCSPDGIQYALVNYEYTGGGNAPMNGKNALLTCSVTYTFTGFLGFQEGDIGNVQFNYGTGFNPTPIPVPGAALLGVIGLSTIAWVRRRRS